MGKREALDDPRTPISKALIEKLDALTEAEWSELTDWLIARFQIESDKRGVELLPTDCACAGGRRNDPAFHHPVCPKGIRLRAAIAARYER